MLSNWCWRRLLRVPWIARRSNQSILKEINPEYSLEGLMLKLQYPGLLMQRADSLEKTLKLRKIKGRRRGQQRMRWLDGIQVAQSCPTLCNPMDLAYQAPPSMEFSRQEYWSGLPFPSPGDLPNQGSNPVLLHCRQTLYHLGHQGSPIQIIYSAAAAKLLQS